MAAAASPTASASICQSRNHSRKTWRLAAVSSAMSTRRVRGRSRSPAAVRSPGRGLRLEPEAGCEGEGAAPARLTLDEDLPAHEGHEPGGDGQAQSGAFVLARRRGILLLERPEDARLLLLRNANAGVAHFE